MNAEVLTAVLSVLGTITGSTLGVIASSRLTQYRIEQLEKKVEKHNNIIERVYVLERDVKTAFNKLDELREDVKNVELEEMRKNE